MAITGDMLIYRGFRITGIQTERFSQELRLAEGGDAMRHEITLTVSGRVHADDTNFVNTQPPSGFNPQDNTYSYALDGLDAQPRLNRLRAHFQHPRGELQYWAGGYLLLHVFGILGAQVPGGLPDGAHIDLDNGPKPTNVEVVQHANGNVFHIRVTFQIAIASCCVVENDQADCAVNLAPERPPEAPVEEPVVEDIDWLTRNQARLGRDPAWGALDNDKVAHVAWSYTEEKDAAFYSERILEGVLRVSHPDFWPHTMRYLVVPRLAYGYQRQTQRFASSKDKVSLAFTIRDKQKHAAPPPPAVDWECTHTETLNPFGQGGPRNQHHISIRLVGAPGSEKRQMIKTCLDIVEARIGKFRREFTAAFPGADQNLNRMIRTAKLVDTLHNNELRYDITVETTAEPAERDQQVDPADDWRTITGIWLGQIGFPLPNKFGIQNYKLQTPQPLLKGTSLEFYDMKLWPVPTPFDMRSPAGIFATYLQSPCLPTHGVPRSTHITNINQDGTYNSGTPIDSNGGDMLPDAYTVREELHWEAELFETGASLIPADYDGQSPYDLSNSQTSAQGEAAYPYEYVSVDSIYDNDDGVIALPHASRGQGAGDPTATFFEMHAGLATRKLMATVERRGAWPKIPKFEELNTQDPNGITTRLVNHKLLPQKPRLDSDGRTWLYTIHVEYQYVSTRPVREQDTLYPAKDPMISQQIMSGQNIGFGLAAQMDNTPYYS